MAVGVIAMGAQKMQVDWKKDLTIEEVLLAAGISASPNSTITVNGRPAKRGEKIENKAQVVVTPRIDNG